MCPAYLFIMVTFPKRANITLATRINGDRCKVQERGSEGIQRVEQK